METVTITPEQYQELLSGIRLSRLSLDDVTASCNRNGLKSDGIKVKMETKSRHEQSEKQFHALITYTLTAQGGRTTLFRIAATYRVTFDVIEVIPDEFAEIYKLYNLRSTTTPYFRELVSSITGRMELPTFTLPYDVIGSVNID